ncbi:replicative helicase loader/inhibitor [Neobacillus niacini]|uniref:replicative helicase loader/inhibitor n=1 Tax=Neobacillus niacini TaxID=86668 RepID=UPI0030017526
MTKKAVMELLVLIESVYPHCIFKNETIQQWFQFCSEMDYDKVLTKLKNHIRKSPYPPTIADIAVFHLEKNDFQERLQKWMKNERERFECERNNAMYPIPDWLLEYSTRKSI